MAHDYRNPDHPGRAASEQDARKYRCDVCAVKFDLPGMTVHHRELGHPFSYKGVSIDLSRELA